MNISSIKGEQAIPQNKIIDGTQTTEEVTTDTPQPASKSVSAPEGTTKVILSQEIAKLLSQLEATVDVRSSLLEALPKPIKEMVAAFIRETMLADQLLSQGMTATVKAEKTVAAVLQNLAQFFENPESSQLPEQVQDTTKQTVTPKMDNSANLPRNITTVIQEVARVLENPETLQKLAARMEQEGQKSAAPQQTSLPKDSVALILPKAVAILDNPELRRQITQAANTAEKLNPQEMTANPKTEKILAAILQKTAQILEKPESVQKLVEQLADSQGNLLSQGKANATTEKSIVLVLQKFAQVLERPETQRQILAQLAKPTEDSSSNGRSNMIKTEHSMVAILQKVAQALGKPELRQQIALQLSESTDNLMSMEPETMTTSEKNVGVVPQNKTQVSEKPELLSKETKTTTTSTEKNITVILQKVVQALEKPELRQKILMQLAGPTEELSAEGMPIANTAEKNVSAVLQKVVRVLEKAEVRQQILAQVDTLTEEPLFQAMPANADKLGKCVAIVLQKLAQSLEKPEMRQQILTLLTQEVADTASAESMMGVKPEKFAAFLRNNDQSIVNSNVLRNMLTKVAEADAELLPEQYHQIGQKIKELAATFQKMTDSPREFALKPESGSNVLTMSMPLYFGDGSRPYPAYIHIFHQQEQGGNGIERPANDTWIRICMDTENIGVVTTIFHLYQDKQLSLHIAFPDETTTSEFRKYLPNIRQAIQDSSLTLMDTNISSGTGA